MLDFSEVAALVPETAKDILDLRCGDGELGALLKERGDSVHVTGVTSDQRSTAAQLLDEVYMGRPDSVALPFSQRSLDCVIALEAFEQIADPWKFASMVQGWLRPGGILIARVSNAARLGFLAGALEGKWSYDAKGIVDRDRLRFFTRTSFTHLLDESGFVVNDVVAAPSARAVAPSTSLSVGAISDSASEDLDVETLLFRATKGAVASSTVRRSISADFSVVMALHNAADDAFKVIESLSSTEQGASFEIVIVDNASTDALGRLSLTDSGGVRVLRNIANMGMARGFSQGAAEAKGRCIIFVDGPVTFDRECLGELITAFDTDAKAACLAPLVLRPDNSTYSAGLSVTDAIADPSSGDTITVERRTDPGTDSIDAVGAPVWAIRKAVYKSLEGIDLSLKDFHYDTDMSLRVREAQWTVRCVPAARVVLHRDESSDAVPADSKVANSLSRLSRKWSGKLPL